MFVQIWTLILQKSQIDFCAVLDFLMWIIHWEGIFQKNRGEHRYRMEFLLGYLDRLRSTKQRKI